MSGPARVRRCTTFDLTRENGEGIREMVTLGGQLEAEERVRRYLAGLESAVVAFSGGVDSSLVLALAVSELGVERVLAVTANSETYGGGELKRAVDIAAQLGVEHEVIVTRELEYPGFRDNPPERCYVCKRELFQSLKNIAAERGFAFVLDGTNADDEGDYRPGMVAAQELSVRHPLLEAGLEKVGVRGIARRLGLPNWDSPAQACLSSRFPYGESITVEKLEMVARAEAYLFSLGLEQCRVRHHGTLARIEVPAHSVGELVEEGVRESLVEEFKEIGYVYVALDLQGFRSGSLNEVLTAGEGRGSS